MELKKWGHFILCQNFLLILMVKGYLGNVYNIILKLNFFSILFYFSFLSSIFLIISSICEVLTWTNGDKVDNAV